MKKGIIILFSEDEGKIDKHQLANIFNHKDVLLCYVNNGSKDSTLEVLESVKEQLEINTISIIDTDSINRKYCRIVTPGFANFCGTIRQTWQYWIILDHF